MEIVVTVFKDLNIVAFAALALLCMQRWRRNRDSSGAWVASAFGSLAAIAIIGMILPAQPSHSTAYLWLVKGILAVVILFPYLLYRFAVTFDRPRLLLENLANILTSMALLASLAIPRVVGPNDPKPSWVLAYSVIVLTQWTYLFSVVSWRLWRAGKNEAAVPKRRMRTLALGSIGLNVAVLLSSFVSSTKPSAPLLASQILSSACALLFFIGFAPPKSLLAVWRRIENIAVSEIMAKLIAAKTPAEVSDLLLPATRLVGACGAAFISPAGEIIARSGSIGTQEDCMRLIAESSLAQNRSVLVLNLNLGKIIVWMSRYSPFFGSDERRWLEQLGVLADIAMERCALMEQQRTFIGNAAHELRTPLTSIIGLALTLGRFGDRLSLQEHAECVAGIERQGERARTLITNLLDMAQLDSGRLLMSIEPVSLQDVAERALNAAPPPEGATVEIKIEEGVHAAANAERLEQILVNLLMNAYQYGSSPIRIHAIAEGDEISVDISDDGPGVPAELAPHLFDPFTRALGTSARGSGLGLSISRRLTEAFGGSIRYISGSPQGACFKIRLKRAA